MRACVAHRRLPVFWFFFGGWRWIISNQAPLYLSAVGKSITMPYDQLRGGSILRRKKKKLCTSSAHPRPGLGRRCTSTSVHNSGLLAGATWNNAILHLPSFFSHLALPRLFFPHHSFPILLFPVIFALLGYPKGATRQRRKNDYRANSRWCRLLAKSTTLRAGLWNNPQPVSSQGQVPRTAI